MLTRFGALALVVPVLFGTGACAAGIRQPPADRGTITVGVTTNGLDAARLTFRVTVEPAGIAGNVKADAGVFTRSGLPLGAHVVRLLDVPAGCRIDGGGQRNITISQQRRSAVIRFDVHCAGQAQPRRL